MFAKQLGLQENLQRHEKGRSGSRTSRAGRLSNRQWERLQANTAIGGGRRLLATSYRLLATSFWLHICGSVIVYTAAGSSAPPEERESFSLTDGAHPGAVSWKSQVDLNAREETVMLIFNGKETDYIRRRQNHLPRDLCREESNFTSLLFQTTLQIIHKNCLMLRPDDPACRN